MLSTRHDALGRRITPVRTAVVAEPDESLPGLVARAVATNFLHQTGLVMSGADRLLHPGTVGLMPAERLRALAVVLGCEADDLLHRAHPYVEQGRSRGGRIDFGGVVLLREDLLLERRRIAPRTLRDAPHHRAWWLMGLLPYCPLSGERLVETCNDCPERPGMALGWRHGWGVGTCEWCRRVVPASGELGLREDLTAGYRLFADLVCVDPAVREGALARLPERVRRLDAATLVDLALHLGCACRAEPIVTGRKQIAKLPPTVLAEVVSTGASMLARWPDALRGWAARELKRAEGDTTAIARVRRTLRRPGLPHTASAAQLAIWREALPNMFGSFQRSSAAPGPTMVAGEASRITGLGFDQLRLLRIAGVLDTRLEHGRTREYRQYLAEQIHELARTLADCVPASRAEWSLGLPGYAVEQMCCEGIIRMATHPALAIVRPGLQLSATGIRRLGTRLAATARTGECPTGALALGTAAKRFGGGPKPWSAIVRGLLDGSLPFWSVGDGPFARRARVRPDDLTALCPAPFDEGAHHGFAFSSDMIQRDAMEILNGDAPEMRAIRNAGLLQFRGRGTSLRVDRAIVFALARELVWTAELGPALGVRSNILPGMLDRRGIERTAMGWPRSVVASLTDAGFVGRAEAIGPTTSA